MNKKWIYIILSIQAVLILAVGFLLFFSVKNYKILANPSKTSETAAINSMSARLGQIQVDLYQIKAKLGATAPTQ